MFILRRIALNGEETNTILGDVYTLVKEDAKDEFSAIKEYHNIDNSDGEIHSFLTGEFFMPIPLYKKSKYYVMTEIGKTFATLTY